MATYKLTPDDRAYLSEIGIPQNDIERTDKAFAHLHLYMRQGIAKSSRVRRSTAVRHFGHNAVLRAVHRAATGRAVDSIRSAQNPDLVLIVYVK